MPTTHEEPNAAVQLSLEDVRQFLYREARLLDDKEWNDWLALYAPDVEFWMPSWDDDDQLVTDPQTEISLIWASWKDHFLLRCARLRCGRCRRRGGCSRSSE